MHRVVLAIVFGLVCTGVARADVRADQKSLVKFEGMLGRMAGLFGGKAARDGITTTVIVKGDRKMTMSENGGQIVDLAEEKIYDIDTRGKSYKVTTFAELRRQMEEAMKKAKDEQKKQGDQAAPNTSGAEMDIDFKLSDTGQRRAVNGFDAHEVLMTITVHEKGKTIEQSGGMVMTSNIWVAPKVPGMSEVAEFDRRYAEKLASSVILDAQQMAAAMAIYPQMQQALARMQAENVRMDGTPVLTVTKIETVANAEQAAAADAPKKEEPPPTSLGGLGARLGRRALGGNKGDKEAAPVTPGRATVMTMQQELLKVTPSSTDADVAIPAGFKLKS
jgi:hypothetical protein